MEAYGFAFFRERESAAAAEFESQVRSHRRCERHGLGGGNAEETDANGRCERKKFGHSFLLVCGRSKKRGQANPTQSSPGPRMQLGYAVSMMLAGFCVAAFKKDKRLIKFLL